jgi:hypothetical protein
VSFLSRFFLSRFVFWKFSRTSQPRRHSLEPPSTTAIPLTKKKVACGKRRRLSTCCVTPTLTPRSFSLLPETPCRPLPTLSFLSPWTGVFSWRRFAWIQRQAKSGLLISFCRTSRRVRHIRCSHCCKGDRQNFSSREPTLSDVSQAPTVPRITFHSLGGRRKIGPRSLCETKRNLVPVRSSLGASLTESPQIGDISHHLAVISRTSPSAHA